MKKSFFNLNIIIIFSVLFSSEAMHAQLGFCQGNSGDPIFLENFGTGLNDTPLPAGTTSYTYANGAEPGDGLYTVSSNTNYFDWFDIEDHTANDVNGRMLVVNSSFSAGEFYRTTIVGLCENTSYEFSSWIVNLTPSGGFCGAGAIPVNVRFEIWDSTDTNLLASGNTGNIGSSSTPNWQQYALVFQTIPSQTSVILKMINNGSGGCGNDLAIDDIVFKSCGDFIDVTDNSGNDSISLCSSETPFSTSLTATPDNTVFSNHFYQWQESPDSITWTDIPGATNELINITGITSTTFYRAKVAEFAANLNNLDCITFSDTFLINVVQAPNEPSTECWETATLNPATCQWEITGTQPAEPTGLECWESTMFNNTTCSWEVTGSQPAEPTGLECWETTAFDNTTCSWIITGNQPTPPSIECWETTTFNNNTCSWEVTGTQPAEPTGLECWETTVFNDTTCLWEITGTQPTPPTLECWETTTFNNNTCSWEVTGTQPSEPTGLECWELTSFNNATCSWEISGSQPDPPADLECWESTSFDIVTCTWIITGTQPTEPTNLECWQSTTFNDTNCSWDVSGTEPVEPIDLECWQTTSFNEDTCSWEILGTQPIDFFEEFATLCEDETLVLQADTTIINPTYLWNTGETTSDITVDTSGLFIVTVTDGCLTTEITYNVVVIETPNISDIQSDGNDIIVFTSNIGEFLYSIDGVNFQTSNTFYDVVGGKYTIYVTTADCDEIVEMEFIHFYIPKFFTPNGDVYNNTFLLNGIECFSSTEVYIFDRYGKLLFSAKNKTVAWDGTFNNNPLPTADYWYLIIIEGQEFKGHFTLKR
ncbi:T9SS type B sorting domain-containing protein [Formosa sp. Hel1_31_208]|uniref:T9SS type B sorting domain-containing protein n=1 Tax=Formosa sp. Hel1_31_208 TaxID=1798225 RepID=UPI0012FD3C45|nr:T9SS type B sorting domain-containing protein [Formosa sp. Hel1_31_208]